MTELRVKDGGKYIWVPVTEEIFSIAWRTTKLWYLNEGRVRGYYKDDEGNRKSIYLHQLVTGDIGPHHHIDLNKLNNNKDNLRIVTDVEHGKIHAKAKKRCPTCGRFSITNL